MKITDLTGIVLTLGVCITSSVMAEIEDSDLFTASQSANSSKALIDGSAGGGGTSIRYKSFAASGMKSIYGPSNAYNYSGGGCMKATAPTTYMGLDEVIDLPVGSRIVSLTLMTHPTSSTDTQTALIYTSVGGVYSVVESVSVSDDSISGFVSEGVFLDHTLSYNVLTMARLEQSGNTAEVCGMRIGYISPDVASDVLFASNFFK